MDRTVRGAPDRDARSEQLGGPLRVVLAQREIGQPGQGLGDHRCIARGAGGGQRLGVPVAGRVQVTFGAGQVAETGGGHRADLLGDVRRGGHLRGADQGLACGLRPAVQAGQVAGGINGEGPELRQAEPLGVGQRPGQLGSGRLPLAREPQLPHHEQAELHLVFGATEGGDEFRGLPVMADRGGMLAPPPFQHGQAAERYRLPPPLPQLSQDPRPGQEIRFRLGMAPTNVERPVPAEDQGDRGHPRIRVTGRVVEDVRADRASRRVGHPEEGGERAEQRHDRVDRIGYPGGERSGPVQPVGDGGAQGRVHGQQRAHRVGHGQVLGVRRRHGPRQADRLADQLGPLDLHAAQRPVPAEGGGQPHRGRPVAGRDRAADRGVQVVLVSRQRP